MRSKAFSWSASVTAGQPATSGARVCSLRQRTASGCPEGPITLAHRSSEMSLSSCVPPWVP
eukprot:4206016-Lingulodinium_polyedra.AAC.1